MADKKISALTAATTPLAGTEVLPIVQSGSTVKVANNDLRPKQIQSNATSGVLQVVGPAAAATRVMTVPDANFTAARTDAAQTFAGTQTFSGNISMTDGTTGNSALIVALDGSTNYVDIQAYNYNVGYSDILYLNRSGGDVKIGANIIPATAAKGVNFTANTPAAGMTSQLLNWYETGTFTPTFVPNAGAGFTSVTYNSVTGGRYTRIGNVVHIQCVVRTDAITVGSATGALCIGGLPFTAVANTTGRDGYSTFVAAQVVGWAGTRPLSGSISASGTTIILWGRSSVSGDTAATDVTDLGTGSAANYIELSGSYICA